VPIKKLTAGKAIAARGEEVLAAATAGDGAAGTVSESAREAAQQGLSWDGEVIPAV
jgi:hypothetical protein